MVSDNQDLQVLSPNQNDTTAESIHTDLNMALFLSSGCIAASHRHTSRLGLSDIWSKPTIEGHCWRLGVRWLSTNIILEWGRRSKEHSLAVLRVTVVFPVDGQLDPWERLISFTVRNVVVDFSCNVNLRILSSRPDLVQMAYDWHLLNAGDTTARIPFSPANGGIFRSSCDFITERQHRYQPAGFWMIPNGANDATELRMLIAQPTENNFSGKPDLESRCKMANTAIT